MLLNHSNIKYFSYLKKYIVKGVIKINRDFIFKLNLDLLAKNTFIIIFLKKSTLLSVESLIEHTTFITMKNTYRLVYIFRSYITNKLILMEANYFKNKTLPSLEQTYASSSWLERENYEMFGIMYKNHSDLRRLLTDYGFNDFPLKKTYPVQGYKEIRYSSNYKQLIYIQKNNDEVLL